MTQTLGILTFPVPDNAVSVCTPPTSPSLIKNPIKGFVLEMVKVVLIPVAKVDVAAGESIVAPSATVYPPVSSDPVIIVKAVV